MCPKEIFELFKDGFEWFGNLSGYVVDIFEFLAVVIAVGIFIAAMVIPMVRPIRKFLGKYGLTFGEAVAILWNCQSNRYLYLRFYIESAIFATKGKPMDIEGWRKLRGLFLERLTTYKNADEKNAQFTIAVDQVSDIISKEMKSIIAEYFSFLAGEKKVKKFWPEANVDDGRLRKDAFCSVVTVSGGYLAPLARIAGLNDRYEENWRAIMDNFAVISNKKDSLPRSVFSYTYTWLMWGPSIQTAQLDTVGADVLGIYGFSDEAQSIFVSIPRSHFESHFNDGVICTACEISGHIVNPISYVSSHEQSFNEDSYPFLDRIKQQYRSSQDYILDVDTLKNVDKCDHYFTAYIWAMFLAHDTTKSEFPELRFSDCLVFFEHTNLADRNNTSLKNVYDILADKFIREMKNPANKHFKYHFVAALNSDAEEVLREKLGDMKNVSFAHEYKMGELLESIDSHFGSSEGWDLLPAESYGDLVPLFRKVYGKKADFNISELFKDIAGKGNLIIAIRNQHGDIAAAGIIEKINGKYTVTTTIRLPDSIVGETEIKGFSDREIRTKMRNK